MSPATLESPAIEFDFDTLGLDLLSLDATDDQPGNEHLADDCIETPEFIPDPAPESGPVFTDNQMFTLEDDEPRSLEAEPLSPLQLPASIQASMEAPAPCDSLTRRQELTEEINTLESQVVEYSETEFELAEKVSQVRKWRKEALQQLRALKWQLNAMSDEDAERPAFESKAMALAGPSQVSITAGPLPHSHLFEQARQAVAEQAIDGFGQQSLTALGLTPKQLEKFEIEGIRTVSQFERALADRSIENVRGIQERTMDKLRESLWEFRKQHPIPDPDDRPVLTASERDAKMEATEASPTPTVETQSIPAEQPAEENMGNKYRAAHQAGQVARRMGIDLSANPIKDAPFLASHWEDGWREEDEAHQEIAKRLAAGAKGEAVTVVSHETGKTLAEITSEAAGDDQATKKRGRKPKATKPE